LADVYPKHLSGGELKRVAIARALINNPDYVIADEPTGDLDTETTVEIMRLLKEIAENGTGVIMVTHELEVLDFGSRTFLMDKGELSLYQENSRQRDFLSFAPNVYLNTPEWGKKEDI